MVGSCTVNAPLHLVRAEGKQGPQKAAVAIPTQPEEWPVIPARGAPAQTSAPIVWQEARDPPNDKGVEKRTSRHPWPLSGAAKGTPRRHITQHSSP